MVANDLVDDEGKERLGEFRIESRFLGQAPKAGNLRAFTLRIARRQSVFRLQSSDLLCALESFRQQMNDRRVQVVDAAPEVEQLLMWPVPCGVFARHLRRVSGCGPVGQRPGAAKGACGPHGAVIEACRFGYYPKAGHALSSGHDVPGRGTTLPFGRIDLGFRLFGIWDVALS